MIGLHYSTYYRSDNETNESFWQSVYNLISSRASGSYSDVKNEYYNDINNIINKIADD